MQVTHKCTKCGVQKLTTDFYRKRKGNEERRRECKVCTNKSRRINVHSSPRNCIQEKLKDAERRGKQVSVTWLDIQALYEAQEGRCALTNRVINFTNKNKLSIDRIDSSKGYVEGNIQLVCRAVNYAKHALSQQEFIELCKEVVAFTSKPLYTRSNS